MLNKKQEGKGSESLVSNTLQEVYYNSICNRNKKLIPRLQHLINAAFS